MYIYAVRILPTIVTIGNGNSAAIRGSLFTGNSARYGGALVLKSFAFFLDKSSLSHHQVSDWLVFVEFHLPNGMCSTHYPCNHRRITLQFLCTIIFTCLFVLHIPRG